MRINTKNIGYNYAGRAVSYILKMLMLAKLRKYMVKRGNVMTTTQTGYQEIADYFIALSNDTENLITNLKLQKLVYYVQAWHLAVFKEPVFEDNFEAWVHGPVIPQLYRDYKQFSYNPISEEKEASDTLFSNFSSEIQTILSDVTEEYFGRTAYELEQLTHSEDPWIKARNGISASENSSQVIEQGSMKDYYSSVLAA